MTVAVLAHKKYSFNCKLFHDLNTTSFLKSDDDLVPFSFLFIGFGQSRSPRVAVNHARYMEELIKALSIARPIVVSPSMSGAYFLPYVLHGKICIFFLLLNPSTTEEVVFKTYSH